MQLLLAFNKDGMETKKFSSSSGPFLGLIFMFVALVSGSVYQPLHFRENEPHLTSNALFQTYQCFGSETFRV